MTTTPQTTDTEKDTKKGIIAAALYYAKHYKYAVLPCEPNGKKPLTTHGCHDATTDLEQIKRWWTQYPNANVGIATGAKSGVVVLDVDGEEGKESLREIENLIDLPLTPRSLTGGGGEHLFFKHPGTPFRNSVRIRPGLDIRGDGGYVIAPPSVHASGKKYAWSVDHHPSDVKVADFPDALLNLLYENKREVGSKFVLPEQIPQGCRNDILFKHACSLQAKGMEREEALEAVRAINQKRCAKPLDAEEIEKILDSAFVYPKPIPIKKIQGTGGWLDPVKLPVLAPLAPVLPPEMVPHFIRPWLVDIAERMQVPLELAAAPALVTIGSTIGRRCRILPKAQDDWAVYPNLWGALVAPASMMKSPVISEVLYPLRTLTQESQIEYEQSVKDSEAEATIIEIRIKSLNKEIESVIQENAESPQIVGLKESLFRLNAEKEACKTPRRRYFVNDATTEILIELLRDNPAGLLVLRDELFGFLKGLEKQGRESDRSLYLEAWNGNGGFVVDRIGRGTIIVPSLCTSIFGGIQPTVLQKYFSEVLNDGGSDDGFFSRFQVTVYPESPKTWKRVDRFPDEGARENSIKLFRWLVGIGQAETPLSVRFEPEAQKVFDQWQEELENRLRSEEILSEAFIALLGKYRKLMPALALIFAAIGAFESGRQFSSVDQQSTVLAAAWTEFFEQHARKIYAGSLQPSLKAAYELMRRIKRGDVKDGDSTRNTYRKGWSFLNTPQKLDEALAVLEEHRWLRLGEVPAESKGRPTEVIRLNPHLKKGNP